MKKKLKFFFLLAAFLLFIPICIFCQVSIYGKAPAFPEKELKIYTYRDYITRVKTLIGSAWISKEGKFSVTIPDSIVFSPVYGIIRIENFSSTIYFEKDAAYEVIIKGPDSADFSGEETGYMNLEILNGKPSDLNFRILAFNEKYNQFLRANYGLFLKKSGKAAVDSFKTEILSEFQNSGNQFLNTHIYGYLASLDLIATSSRQKVYSDFLSKVQVEYGSDSYMNFLNEFYNKQIESFSDPFIRELLVNSVNEKKSYSSSMEALSKEKLLGNEQIRELVLLKILFENYNNKEFDKKSIRLVLQELMEKTTYAMHRKIGMDILVETGKLNPGAIAPEFTLLNQHKKKVSLNDFKGKYVYLDFWATWCIPCITDMPLIEELNKKFGKNIVFVSVSIDKEFNTMKKFLEKKKEYNWTFLHNSMRPELVEMYNVLAIPAYFLIDPKGIIIRSPAEKPGGNLEDTFIKLISEKKTNKKLLEWE